MNVLKLLASDSFITVNKDVARVVGIDAAVILGELASEYNYYESREQLDSDGYFYSTVENVERATTLTDYQQRKALKALEALGIVKIIRKGIPAKRYVKLFPEQVEKLFDNQFLKNFRTVDQKTKEQHTKKLEGNNNKEIRIENNNINNNKWVDGETMPEPVEPIEEYFNTICVDLPHVTKMTDKRKKKLKSRLKTFTAEQIVEAFKKIQKSDFASRSERRWCSFDWIIDSDDHLVSILEGKYDNRVSGNYMDNGKIDWSKV